MEVEGTNQMVFKAEDVERRSMDQEDEDMAEVPTIKPAFPALKASQLNQGVDEYRKIRVPNHRYTPLRENWEHILRPLVEYLKLQVGRKH